MSAFQSSISEKSSSQLKGATVKYQGKIPLWSRIQLAGRLCELSSIPRSALLTAAFRLVLDAQMEGEPTAWIAATPGIFFPPDADANGVDLHALVVVRVPDNQAAACSADRLLRSGAFGLIVMDLNSNPTISIALQARLAQQARIHNTTILCLTSKARNTPSLGSLVSLRGQTSCRRLGTNRFQVDIEFLKDKRHEPGWHHTEICCGPDGLH